MKKPVARKSGSLALFSSFLAIIAIALFLPVISSNAAPKSTSTVSNSTGDSNLVISRRPSPPPPSQPPSYPPRGPRR